MRPASKVRRSRSSRFVPLVLAAAVLATGCAGDERPSSTDSANLPTTEPSTSTGTATAASVQRVKRTKPRPYRACDSNVRARRRTTSCAFAQNAFYEFWRAGSEGSGEAIRVFSPTTEGSYDLRCTGAETVTCAGEGRVGVRFPMAAIEAYDAEQAARYCAAHAVSEGGIGVGCRDEAPVEASPPDDETCDPNYEGACLDPTASDYDCEGGEGDGPEYVGTVTVVGDDHFGLDRNGDGVGCE